MGEEGEKIALLTLFFRVCPIPDLSLSSPFPVLLPTHILSQVNVLSNKQSLLHTSHLCFSSSPVRLGSQIHQHLSETKSPLPVPPCCLFRCWSWKIRHHWPSQSPCVILLTPKPLSISVSARRPARCHQRLGRADGVEQLQTSWRQWILSLSICLLVHLARETLPACRRERWWRWEEPTLLSCLGIGWTHQPASVICLWPK